MLTMPSSIVCNKYIYTVFGGKGPSLFLFFSYFRFSPGTSMHQNIVYSAICNIQQQKKWEKKRKRFSRHKMVLVSWMYSTTFFTPVVPEKEIRGKMCGKSSKWKMR